MSRWSPTVLAEAPPPRTSMLGKALGVGYDIYKDQREQQQRQAAAALAEKRRQEEIDWREAQQAHQLDRESQADALGAFERGTRLAAAGWRTTEPGERPDTRNMGAAPLEVEHDAPAPGFALRKGDAPYSVPKAGNSGPGGADSQAQPQWYLQGVEQIKAKAKADFPGSGTVAQRDPQTGQTYYLPVRRQYEDAEI